MKEDGEIILEVPNSETQSSSVSPLIPYFTNLPLKNQMKALQGGYKAVSSEFSEMAGKVKEPLVTMHVPESIQDKLSRELPLLSVEKQNNANGRIQPLQAGTRAAKATRPPASLDGSCGAFC